MTTEELAKGNSILKNITTLAEKRKQIDAFFEELASTQTKNVEIVTSHNSASVSVPRTLALSMLQKYSETIKEDYDKWCSDFENL
jgi:glycine/serine hydroxymethyltransferase